MARYRTDMNSIYISPRAQEALDPIAQCPLTTVVAPMGYGKTTAVQWFLDRRREAGDQVVRVSIYSNDLPLFWRSFQAAWRGTPLAGQLDPMAFPVGDRWPWACCQSVCWICWTGRGTTTSSWTTTT